MDLKLKGKVAIVTGAGGGGIGTTLCLELARQGACIVANDIDQSWADKVVVETRGMGVKAVATYADVTRLADCQGMVQKALAEFGRVDIMVTIPAYTILKMFVDYTEDEWHKQLDVTFWGVVNAVGAVLDPMIAQHSGSIVCMGSDSGKVGPPKQTIYASAKAAIMNFARSLSKEVGPQGIRINVVNAGMTKTPALTDSGWLTPEKEAHFAKDYPLRRLGEAQEVVEAILFLASERGSFITGQTLSVSGGIA